MEFKNLKTLELYLLDIMNTRSIHILEKIAADYNLDKDTLIIKYIEINQINNTSINTNISSISIDNNNISSINNNDISSIDNNDISSSDISSDDEKEYCNNNDVINIKSNKKVLNKIIDDNFRCIAVTRMGTRCKRSKRNADYCNIHLKKMNVII